MSFIRVQRPHGAPRLVHVVKTKIARLTGLQHDIRLCYRAADGSPGPNDFEAFEVFLG